MKNQARNCVIILEVANSVCGVGSFISTLLLFSASYIIGPSLRISRSNTNYIDASKLTDFRLFTVLSSLCFILTFVALDSYLYVDHFGNIISTKEGTGRPENWYACMKIAQSTKRSEASASQSSAWSSTEEFLTPNEDCDRGIEFCALPEKKEFKKFKEDNPRLDNEEKEQNKSKNYQEVHSQLLAQDQGSLRNRQNQEMIPAPKELNQWNTYQHE